MGDSFPETVYLPKLQFQIGEEPNAEMKINQFPMYEYINIVSGILSAAEFQRITDSFLGPALKVSKRGLMMSAKIVHSVLCRSLQTLKKSELRFHFGGQPMRFSIREFHMVTGLKCSEWKQDENVEYKTFGWANSRENHTVEDVVKILRSIDEEETDLRVSLGMLVLIESIYLQLYKGCKFLAKYLDNAQDIRLMMNYSWGRDAYTLLLGSIRNNVTPSKKTKTSNLLKGKYDLQGFPLAFLIWILESVPQLQTSYSRISTIERSNAFLCEKYTFIGTPTIAQVQNIEATCNLKVICILPSIADDPEDTVSLEDDDDQDLSLMVELVNKGYRMRVEDWSRGLLDVGEAMEEIAVESFNLRHKETVRAASTSESLVARLEKLCKIVEDGFNITNSRLSKIEEEVKKLSAAKTTTDKTNEEDWENNEFYNSPTHNIPTDSPSQHSPTPNLDPNGEDYSPTQPDTIPVTQPITQPTTQPTTQNSENIPLTEPVTQNSEIQHEQTTPEIEKDLTQKLDGSQTEDLTQKLEGTQTENLTQKRDATDEGDTEQVPDIGMEKDGANGDEQEENNQENESRGMENIFSTSPSASQACVEVNLMEEVEVHHENKWRKGNVRAILKEHIRVFMYDLRVVHDFRKEEARYISREKGNEQNSKVKKNATTPKAHSPHGPHVKKNKNQLSEIKTPSFDLMISSPPQNAAPPDVNKEKKRCNDAKTDVAVKKRRFEARPPEMKKKDRKQHLPRRSGRVITPSQPTVTPYKAPRNPATGRHPVFDPFLSPSFVVLEELSAWKNSISESSIDPNKAFTPQWFSELEKRETYLHETHINAALTLMCKRRNSDPSFFHCRRLPRSSFVGTKFLRDLANCYIDFKKDKTGYNFPAELVAAVRGEVPPICPPNKKWEEDIDGFYGLIQSEETNQWVGVEISFRDRRVTVFDCRSDKSMDIVASHVTPFTELLPALSGCAQQRIIHDITSYHLVNLKKNTIHTKVDADCTLLLLKMIECHSMGIEDFSKIRDANDEDVRLKYASDIFKECLNIS